MPYRPYGFGSPRATGHGPSRGPRPPPGIHDGMLSPHGYAAPSTPPRAARSHSASAARRSTPGRPRAVRGGVEPAHADDGPILARKRGLVPLARTLVSRVVEEPRVLAACDGIGRHLERVDVHAMHRTLVVLPGVAAHEERAGGDCDEVRNHSSVEGVTTRWRPYFRTNVSVNRGASALRMASPRDLPSGETSGRGRSTQATIARATCSTVCFGPSPEMRWP